MGKFLNLYVDSINQFCSMKEAGRMARGSLSEERTSKKRTAAVSVMMMTAAEGSSQVLTL